MSDFEVVARIRSNMNLRCAAIFQFFYKHNVCLDIGGNETRLQSVGCCMNKQKFITFVTLKKVTHCFGNTGKVNGGMNIAFHNCTTIVIFD